MIAHGVHETGRREILSIDVGEAETETFWTEFLRDLVARGLVGVGLAISDAHAGLKAAIAKVLGCTWQRCTVHFLRDCLGHARKDQHGLLAALIRPIFNADSLAQARDRLSEAVAHLDGRLGKVATMLEDAEPDILAFYAFPPDHWRKLRSTNPLERFNREIARRTDVVGIFPDNAALIRLAGMLCIEQNDEWLVGRRYLSAESISLVSARPDDHSHKQEKEEAQLQAAEPPIPTTTIKATRSYTTSRDLTRTRTRPAGPARLRTHRRRLASRSKGGCERDTGARIKRVLKGPSRAADHKPLTSALRYVSHSHPPTMIAQEVPPHKPT